MLAISHFSPKKIELILDQALEMADGKKYTAQDEIFVSNLFFEDSTRTKISFEMAERKLGLSVIPFDTSQSSVNKGESLYDTAKTLESIGLNLLVIRHGQNQYYDELKNIKIPIINAGDGTGNHPSQTMLDLMTIKQEFGSFKDLKIAIAGDVKHSRVANSACDILRKLGAKVYFSGPREWFDEGSLMNGTYREIDGLIPEIDVLMLLRIHHERREKKMKPNAIIMHPAPVNRNVEIASDLVECSRSRIFKQMENGVFARMAILKNILEQKGFTFKEIK